MDKAVRVPSIRQLTGDNVRDVVADIIKWVNTRQGLLGDGLDKAVTLRELAAMGVSASSGSGSSGGSSGGGTDPGTGGGIIDPPQPPTPTGLTALGTPTAILLAWNMPQYRRVLNYEVWRSATNALGDAVLLATPTAQTYYDPVGTGQAFYYWVRAKSDAGLYSPFNAVAGTLGQTGYLAADLLAALTGQITSTQLSTALASTIGLITADSSVPGSVNSRIADLQGQIDTIVAATTGDLSDVIAALQTETNARIAGDAAETAARTTAISAVNSDIAAANAAIVSESTTRATAISGLSTQISGLTTTVTNNYNTLNSAIVSANQARVDGDAVLTTSLNGLIARLNNFNGVSGKTIEARLTEDRQARIDGDAALTSQITTLTATVNSNNTSQTAAVQNEASVRAAADGTLANQISTVQSTVNGQTTSIQTLTTSVNGLSGRYTVKIDNNGYVTGFGLASEQNNGAVVSQFQVRADSFAITSPTGPGIAPRTPFIVRTTPTTIGGVTIPAGVYIDTAAIQDVSIDSAKIVSLVANKITAGFINAAIGMSGASVFGATLYSGGTTTVQTDSNGNVTGFVANNPTFSVVNGIAQFEVNAFRVRNGNTVEIPFEVSGGVVRIKDANIANVIQAANYVPNVDGWRLDKSGLLEAYNIRARGAIYGGAFTQAWGWPASGTGFHLGPSGLLLGNPNTGRFFEVTSAGDIAAPGLVISGGSAVFSGSLSAATGTFSGTLTASAVNAVDTINLAGEAVIVPRAARLSSAVSLTAAGTGAEVTVASTTLNPRGGGLYAVFTGRIVSPTINSSAATGRLTLYINGVAQQFDDAAVATGTDGANQPFCIAGFVPGLNADVTVEVRLQRVAGTSRTFTVNAGALLYAQGSRR